MRLNKLFDIILSVEEYELLNETAELRNFSFDFGDEKRLIIGEDDLDYILLKLEAYLYDENSMRGSVEYEDVKVLYDTIGEFLYED